MISQIRPALVVFLLLTVFTGGIYPMVVTGLGAALFHDRAAGSLIVKDGKLIGSRLIGQNFSDPKYFWGRPSATSPMPYNPLASSGSNQGPLNPALVDAVKSRIEALRAADPENTAPVPVDLVTASGSGLDPDISIAAANYQVARVARLRGLQLQQVSGLVAKHSHERTFGVLGEPSVNVLELNLALDALAPVGNAR